ncbi:MAG: response regulator transcription factor [Kofleriaceae bacterium]|nr:response regulator transcription factor [Kofleriaceae bacterium]
MKVLLVDDHELLRRGVRELLTETFTDAEFGEAGTGEDAVAMVAESPWDLIILDLAMPRRGGLDALREIHARCPDVPVVVLSASEDEHYAVRALRGGARGYVTKQTTSSELVGAVKKAIAGTRYLSPSLMERIADSAIEPKQMPHEDLSDRELQVLRMIALGKSVKDIGVELALSEKTISTYRARILTKMKLGSNAELMRYALRSGLVD